MSYLEGKQGQQFYDIVLYDNLLYLCIRSHTSVSTETPKQNVASGKIKYWEVAQSWTFIATKLLLTEKIKASMIDADGIRAVNVDISGKITADSGRIGPFSIDSACCPQKLFIRIQQILMLVSICLPDKLSFITKGHLHV